MKNNPYLSIIVPVYNSEDFISKCVDSILVQTYKNFEVILVNDGSTDKSGVICEGYRDKDHRVKVIHTRNQGHGGARNEALNIAKGTYIGMVDSDDWIDSDMFELLIHVAEKYEAEITECAFMEHYDNVIKRNRPISGIVSGSGSFILHEFFTARMAPSLCNKIYKRSVFSDYKFPLGRSHVDFYANVTFAIKSYRYVRIPEAKYHYFIRENSITNTYTGQKLREAIYLYDYTLNLANNVAKDHVTISYLKNDAIARILNRFYFILYNANSIDSGVYNRIIKNRLGGAFIKFVISANIPLKTKFNYILMILNKKKLLMRLHSRFSKGQIKINSI